MKLIAAAAGWLLAAFLLRRSWVDWHAGWEEGQRAGAHHHWKRGYNAAMEDSAGA